MTEGTLEWIKQLIRDDDLHGFYTSQLWRKKQSQILKDNHNECSRCKARGKVAIANTVHHKKYLRRYPDLALEDSNLEPVCEACHYSEHHTKKGFMNEERW